MPQFLFTARDRSGRLQSGVLSAETSSQLAALLRGRGWLVTEVRDAGRQSRRRSARPRTWNPFHWLPATRFDVEMGLQQIATMLRSGMTLLTALRTAAGQARRQSMSRVWTTIGEHVEEGSTLTESLGRFGKLFPPMVTQMVRVGEESGTLDQVMRRAAQHLERQRAIRVRVINALLYPAFVLTAAAGVSAFMVFSLIPKLQRFLVQRGRRLPRMSQMLLDYTTWLNEHGTLMLVSLVGLLVLMLIARRWTWIRVRIDRKLIVLPIIGRIFRLAGTATVARGLSILLESGITLLTALPTVKDLLTNHAMRRRLDAVRSFVMGGGSLAEEFINSREFMPMLGRMMAVGEVTGALAPVLEEVADFHEDRLEAVIRRFSVMVEPVLIIVVGSIVGFVYIAFFMALFSVAAGGR